MKASLLVAAVALTLTGCCSTKPSEKGGTGASFEAETSSGRAMHWENDMGPNDPEGPFHNWRYGGDANAIPPSLPVNPHKQELQPPVLPTEPPDAPGPSKPD